MPRPKIIDDTKLTKLFRERKSLKQIGNELGVSHVAIYKRVKRLGLSQLPKSFENLTDKEKRFCLSVAGGHSRINAVMQTYDVTSRESAKALQKTLMKDPKIRTAIDDQMEIKGIGREFRIEKLGEHMRHVDPVVSLKALDMGFKLAGDEEAAKQKTPENLTFIKVDLVPYRNIGSFNKREKRGGWERCLLCNETKVDAGEEFCEECKKKYVKIIDKILRYWNGDKCATCTDERRCYNYCKACNEELEGGFKDVLPQVTH